MPSVLTRRVPLWPFLLALLLLAAAGVFLAAQALPGFKLFGTESEERNTQVINAVTREEQVVLLSLGIQGIAEQNETFDFQGWEIPGTKRASFIQYGFTAKVGLDGEDVTIDQTGENQYLVSIPEFIFIGHDNEDFRVVTEDNGVLSWITPPIDPVEMINDVLDDDAKGQYIESNRGTLQDQTEAFYNGIIRSVDEDVVVEYEFAG